MPGQHAQVTFDVCLAGARFRHQATVELNFIEQTGAWEIPYDSLKWATTVPIPFRYDLNTDALKNTQSLLQKIVRGFGIMALGSIPNETETGFRVKVHNLKVSPEEYSQTYSAIRHQIVAYYRPKWEDLWTIILNRAQYDPQLSSTGFNKEEILRAFSALKRSFPWNWVQKRQGEALGIPGKEAILWRDIEHDYVQWFPLYILTRLANGFLCRDPGLAALIGLGLEVENLKRLPGAERLLQQIGSEGFLFQVLLSANLSRRGFLVALERPSGGTQDDIVAEYHSVRYSLDVKTVQTLRVSWINKTLTDKHKKLPKSPMHPVLIVVFPLERGLARVELEVAVKEKRRDPKVAELVSSIPEEEIEWTPKVSAIVFCSMFVDGTGPARVITMRVVANPNVSTNVNKVDIIEMLTDAGKLGIPQFHLPMLIDFVMPPVED